MGELAQKSGNEEVWRRVAKRSSAATNIGPDDADGQTVKSKLFTEHVKELSHNANNSHAPIKSKDEETLKTDEYLQFKTDGGLLSFCTKPTTPEPAPPPYTQTETLTM